MDGKRARNLIAREMPGVPRTASVIAMVVVVDTTFASRSTPGKRRFTAGTQHGAAKWKVRVVLDSLRCVSLSGQDELDFPELVLGDHWRMQCGHVLTGERIGENTCVVLESGRCEELGRELLVRLFAAGSRESKFIETLCELLLGEEPLRELFESCLNDGKERWIRLIRRCLLLPMFLGTGTEVPGWCSPRPESLVDLGTHAVNGALSPQRVVVLGSTGKHGLNELLFGPVTDGLGCRPKFRTSFMEQSPDSKVILTEASKPIAFEHHKDGDAPPPAAEFQGAEKLCSVCALRGLTFLSKNLCHRDTVVLTVAPANRLLVIKRCAFDLLWIADSNIDDPLCHISSWTTVLLMFDLA